jgi:restriction system protein
VKNYYRIMLGKKSVYAQECFEGGFIGTDFGIKGDLSRKLPEHWRDFNKEFIPIFLKDNPGKVKISAGLACGALWTISKGVKKGDVVLSPDGSGSYRFGEVLGEYYYSDGDILPHRRKIRWLNISIPRSTLSESLQNSTGSIGTVSNVSDHGVEIEKLISSSETSIKIFSSNSEIEDPSAFDMEKHLEEFLVKNWDQTLLAKDFMIYEEDGDPVGKQYSTEAGDIDILAISKDKKRILVVELKRGRASDLVVGQLLRYMGFVKEQIAEADQTVEGAIIALEDDSKLRWALSPVSNITFYRYQISFKLVKGAA